MHCLACDRILTDFEATRKSSTTDEFIDLCNKCFKTISDDVKVSERDDLKEYEDDETPLEFIEEETWPNNP
jgi:hypothetical protein